MIDTELAKRVEKLELDNRRMKRGGIAFLVLLVALGTIYATRPVPNVIKAREFEAVDTAGRVRVDIGTALPDGGTGLTVYNVQDYAIAELEGGGSGTTLLLGSSTLSSSILMRDISDTPSVTLFGPRTKAASQALSAAIAKGDMKAWWKEAQRFPDEGISIGVPTAGPTISMSDHRGFNMIFGSTETVTPRTGQEQKTSADSIIMFGNDKKHHVIWQAPQ